MPISYRESACTYISLLLPVFLMTSACTGEKVEEVVFRETMEYQLEQDCGEDKECKDIVETQMEYCMEKSDWRSFLNNQEDAQELQRFIKEFFPCFKDPDGNPYFGKGLAP